jgi:hypothetical protein
VVLEILAISFNFYIFPCHFLVKLISLQNPYNDQYFLAAGKNPCKWKHWVQLGIQHEMLPKETKWYKKKWERRK